LRIDVASSTANLIIIPALHDFFSRYPDIQLDVGVSDRNVDLIADNVDCVIRGGEIADQSLVARRIGNLAFITAASPAYLKRYGVPQHPSELEKKHRVVGYFSGSTRRLFADEFNKAGERIEVNGYYSVAVNENNAHTHAVLSGLGVSQVARFVAQPYLDSGELVEVLSDWTRDPLPVYVVYPPNRHLSAKVRAFVDWAAELFAKEPLLQQRN
jgi:DNA-binding transcriptional LysR family regulator